MRERAILFSTEMVQSILQGRKIQTRRITSQQVHRDSDYTSIIGGKLCWANKPCPYGQVGDRLYVRETWCKTIDHDEPTPGYLYKAEEDPDGKHSGYKWKPSIHMPKKAARIWLEITDVRIERIMDISGEDCEKEGTPVPIDLQHYIDAAGASKAMCLIMCFQDLWDSINGEGATLKNPWVWVIEFKKI